MTVTTTVTMNLAHLYVPRKADIDNSGNKDFGIFLYFESSR